MKCTIMFGADFSLVMQINELLACLLLPRRFSYVKVVCSDYLHFIIQHFD